MTNHKFEIVSNPAYAGRKPQRLGPACHDGSAPLDMHCSCGQVMHLHESQITKAPKHAIIGALCKGCGDVLELDLDDIRKAYKQMRDDGWHA